MDYGGSAAELEAYFSPCGEIHRVTILCDKFSGHPKGSVGALAGWAVWVGLAPHSWLHRSPPLSSSSYAYIEFASKSSVQAAVRLDESTFRGRVIKVCFPWCLHAPAGGAPTEPCTLTHKSFNRLREVRVSALGYTTTQPYAGWALISFRK